ncbi:MAG: hypothetical protein ACYCYM_14340 [Saccharofermentanales bacterium]
MDKEIKACPVCTGRACDVSILSDGRVEVELKCPHCSRIVNVPCNETQVIKAS